MNKNTKYEIRNTRYEKQRGVTLFIAVTIMAVLLFISFVVVNIAVKSTQFAGVARESQLAFSAADSGAECALFWDTRDDSPFDIPPGFVPTDLLCNGETITSELGGSNDVSTIPPQPHCLGGECAEDNDDTSIFQLNFQNGTCAIIEVERISGNSTEIRSRGYNTCDTSNPRRVERGVEISY